MKGCKDRNRHKNRIKRSEQARLVYIKNTNRTFPPREGEPAGPGLKETFIKRNIDERTNKAEIRPEEESQKAKSFQENYWNEIQLKGP